MVASGCSSAYLAQVGGDTDRVYSKTFITSYDVAWDAMQDALKSETFEITSKETGVIQTRWADNTKAVNLSESFEGSHAFVKSEYRLKVNLSKTFFEGVPAVKVSVSKDQIIQQDILDHARPMESNGIDENTILYRVGRLIVVKQKLDDYDKEQKEFEAQSAEDAKNKKN